MLRGLGDVEVPGLAGDAPAELPVGRPDALAGPGGRPGHTEAFDCLPDP